MKPIAIALLLACACSADEEAPPPTVAVEEDPLSAEVTAPSQVTGSSQVTVSGRVFYNDRRNDGNFSTRRTPTGAVGQRCSTAGVRDDGTPCSVNWLGAYYMVVDVYAFDLDLLCNYKLQASVAVGYDGRWSTTFTPTPACKNSDGQFHFRVETRARFCGNTCFSLNEVDHTPYTKAYSTLPRALPGASVAMGDLYFHASDASPSYPGSTAKAANYYASLVDTIVAVHTTAGVPFYKTEFGEVEYIYPSGETSTATAKSASRVVISADLDDGWVGGKTPAHEYGHVMMLRAWDGDYGFDGVGISANDSEIAPSRQIAFKEAWAEFVARVVFANTRGCHGATFDDNATTPLPGSLGEGAQWRLNVTKSLCDWYDTRSDDDLGLAGAGDHFAAENFYSMWVNLRNMYLTETQYGGGDGGDGLWFCDYVDYYLDVRKSSAAVGGTEHQGYVSSLTDLVYQNNIGCYLPSP